MGTKNGQPEYLYNIILKWDFQFLNLLQTRYACVKHIKIEHRHRLSSIFIYILCKSVHIISYANKLNDEKPFSLTNCQLLLQWRKRKMRTHTACVSTSTQIQWHGRLITATKRHTEQVLHTITTWILHTLFFPSMRLSRNFTYTLSFDLSFSSEYSTKFRWIGGETEHWFFFWPLFLTIHIQMENRPTEKPIEKLKCRIE